MEPFRNRGACEKHCNRKEITVFVIESLVHLVGAGSVLIHLKRSFARGTWRKLFDSNTPYTICDKTNVCGKVDGGVDDARLFAIAVKEQGESARSACTSEEGQVVIEKMQTKQKKRRHGGCAWVFQDSMMKDLGRP